MNAVWNQDGVASATSAAASVAVASSARAFAMSWNMMGILLFSFASPKEKPALYAGKQLRHKGLMHNKKAVRPLPYGRIIYNRF